METILRHRRIFSPMFSSVLALCTGTLISSAILVSAPTAAHAQDKEPAMEPMTVVSQPAAPFTEEFSDIQKRDARNQAALQNRKIRPLPRPVPNVFESDEGEEEEHDKIRPVPFSGTLPAGLFQNTPAPPFLGSVDGAGHFIPAIPVDLKSPLTISKSAVGGSVVGAPVTGGGDTSISPAPDPLPNPAQSLGVGFPGPTFSNVGGWYPPDTQGATGPNHVIVLVNGGVRMYTKTGTAAGSAVSLTAFFTATIGGVSYPKGGDVFDPRVLYDRRSGHWFATAMDFGVNSAANDVILAVSRTSDPTGTWDKYVIPTGVASAFTDYSTLGVDDNGVYVGARIFASSSSYVRLFATPKASLVAASPSIGTISASPNVTDMGGTPHPALNLDGSGSGSAWFIGSVVYYYSNDGSGGSYGADISLRRVTWSGSTPSIASSATIINTPAFEYYAPKGQASGSTTQIDTGDPRILHAVVRSGHIWAARNIGVNTSGGHTTGFNSISGTAPRAACEWMDLNATNPVSVSLAQRGVIYDPSATSMFYYYPSLSVSGQGHVALGFSGSNSSQPIGVYTAGRLSTDTASTMQGILSVKTGTGTYNIVEPPSSGGRNRWGDYSFTAVDPNDDQSLWTFQEYTASQDNWGIWSQRLLAPAPTLTGLVSAVSGKQGQRGVTLRVNGTGLWDPGTGFNNRLASAFSGSGISNIRTFYSSPTSTIVQCDIDTSAATGTRNLTITNPDGQTATLNNALTITSASTPAMGATVTGATRSTTLNFTLAVRNSGTTSATGVQVTSATITVGATTTPTSTSLPSPAGGATIAAGGSTNVTLSFPTSVGTTGQSYTLTYKGVTSTGTFSGVTTGTLP